MRIVFFGSPAFAVPSLEAVAADHEVVAVVCQPDRPAGRGRRLAAPAVKARAIALGLPVMQPEGVRAPAFADDMRALLPDAFVVVAYGRILPQALLDVPPRGPWNAHASLLPALRGAAPIQWAIIRGEQRTGVSIMRMEAGLDTGPVAVREEIPIADDDTAGTLSARLAPVGAGLLRATLPAIADGSVKPAPQDDTSATLAPPLRKEDGKLDWSRPAAEVSARARGVDPWPGAWSVLGARPVKLFGPRPAAASAPPGQILALDAAGLCVACGKGALSFAEAQLPGRKRLPAAALAAGRSIAVGARLG